jgi:hypothetical protein
VANLRKQLKNDLFAEIFVPSFSQDRLSGSMTEWQILFDAINVRWAKDRRFSQ